MSPSAPAKPSEPLSDATFLARADRCVRGATGARWGVERVRRAADALVLELATAGEPLQVRVWPATPGGRWYRSADGLAFAYQTPGNRPLGDDERGWLDRTLAGLLAGLPELLAHTRAVLAERLPEPEPEPARSNEPGPKSGVNPGRSTPPVDAPPFPTPEASAHLAARFPLPDGAVESYRRDGFVVLRQVLDPAVLTAARPWILDGLERSWPTDEASERRIDGYVKAFVQITNVGHDSAAVRAFSLAPRLGQLAAELMGVRGVRVYCEDWLLKEPGEGETGWHQDCCVFPFDPEASITAWIPIQAVPPELGLLRLARGSHRLELTPAENITEDGDRELAELVAREGCEIVTVPPFDLGDVSFHDGRTIHGATGNRSGVRRDVLALHMFADGARIKPPTTRTMRHQLSQFGPGLRPGDPAASKFWPLVWRAGEDA